MSEKMATKNIMIVGVGGQGTLLTSRILGKLAIRAGYDVKLSEVHGMAQRGGSVVTFVRYGESVAEPIVEEGQADVLIAFERLEALRYLHFLKKDGVVIVNDWRIDPITVVTGVAGSGKSTLISKVFAAQYENSVVMVDQGPITATSRSTPASYLGFFDAVRKLLAKENGKPDGLFSFNSTGACPVCGGKGVIVTELAFMDPIITECEACGGMRYNEEALACTYKGRNIVELLGLTASQAMEVFEDAKILKKLHVMEQVGLSYLTLGQPLSTLSGGERQRIKLAKNLGKKGGIIIMDEPTTGLHMSDIQKLLKLFDMLVSRGNTLVVIEHNLDVMKQADWIIDIGPDGGKHGGEVVYEGTPADMIKSAKTLTADSLRASCTQADGGEEEF